MPSRRLMHKPAAGRIAMKTMLKLIVVSLVAGASFASAADEAGEKKDKPKGGKGGKGVMAADANKDGKVTSEELKKWGADRKKPMSDKQAEKMMARLDTNKDGAIDAEEVKAGRKKGGKGKKKPEGEAKEKAKDAS